MSKENLERSIADLLAGIDLCFSKSLELPGLTLIYAGIDVLAWLSKPNESDPVGNAFQEWVKTYMLASYKGEVGSADQLAVDLYGARCALLHACIAESDLSRNAKAREVHYRRSDGTGLVPVQGLNAPLVSVDVDPDALRKEFAAAVERFKAKIDGDSTLKDRVYGRSAKYFTNVTFA